MDSWVAALRDRARIIHGEAQAARDLAARLGKDPEAVMEPYLAELERLYIEDLPFAMLADAMEVTESAAADELAAG